MACGNVYKSSPYIDVGTSKTPLAREASLIYIENTPISTIVTSFVEVIYFI